MTTITRSVEAGRATASRAWASLRSAGFEAPAALTIVAASIAAPILIRLSAPNSESDIPAHAAMAAEMVKSGGWFTYTLWYPLIDITSHGSADPVLLRELSVFFLVISVIAKALVTFYIGWAYTRDRWAASAITLLMLVAMPVLDPWHSHHIYLGQVSPNVWHNSTQIFALPISLAAFAAAIALLRFPTRSRALLFSALILASTLAKPNYTLALLPVLGLMLLWSMHSDRVERLRQVWIVAIAFLPTTALLASQYLLVFGSAGVRKTELTFAPLVVWHNFSPNVAVSILVSIAGPLAVYLVLPRQWRSTRMMTLSWLVLVLSVLQLALLAERFQNGSISMDGNFFWGSYTAIFMVFVVSATSLAQAYRAGSLSRRRRAALGAAIIVLSLHAATGIYYLGRAGVAGFPVTR